MGTYQWKPFTLLVSAEEVKGNEMKIEVGKYYRTRDGRKVGPIENSKYGGKKYPFVWNWPNGQGSRIYTADGTNYSNRDDDLISEWLPWETIDYKSPIRTVKRREIVAGKYGIVTIKECGFIHINTMGTPDNLREAAHILNQIAEVLEENGE